MSARARRITGLAARGTVLLAATIGSGHAQSLDWQSISATDKPALADAVSVGIEDNLPLYACRAQAGSGTHPGRFRSDFNGCHIGFDGQEISVTPFEVLKSPWQSDGDGYIPTTSLAAGERVQSDELGHFGLTTLFPCRTQYHGSLQVGEIARGDHGCSFGFGGRQVTEQKYDVLWSAPWMTWIIGIAHQIPPGAVVAGGEGGEAFYVCRAGDRSGLHPGKIKPSSPGCSIVSDGNEVVASQFSLLVPKWLAGNAGTIPGAALPAGEDRRNLLYLCRAQIRNTVQIGKIAEPLASCHVGMMGSEVASQAYDVLSEK